jgi:hypothetical protein
MPASRSVAGRAFRRIQPERERQANRATAYGFVTKILSTSRERELSAARVPPGTSPPIRGRVRRRALQRTGRRGSPASLAGTRRWPALTATSHAPSRPARPRSREKQRKDREKSSTRAATWWQGMRRASSSFYIRSSQEPCAAAGRGGGMVSCEPGQHSRVTKNPPTVPRQNPAADRPTSDDARRCWLAVSQPRDHQRRPSSGVGPWCQPAFGRQGRAPVEGT